MATEAPIKSPTKKPEVAPNPKPVRRYSPEPDHCPAQIDRQVRRIRQI